MVHNFRCSFFFIKKQVCTSYLIDTEDEDGIMEIETTVGRDLVNELLTIPDEEETTRNFIFNTENLPQPIFPDGYPGTASNPIVISDDEIDPENSENPEIWQKEEEMFDQDHQDYDEQDYDFMNANPQMYSKEEFERRTNERKKREREEDEEKEESGKKFRFQ